MLDLDGAALETAVRLDLIGLKFSPKGWNTRWHIIAFKNGNFSEDKFIQRGKELSAIITEVCTNMLSRLEQEFSKLKEVEGTAQKQLGLRALIDEFKEHSSFTILLSTSFQNTLKLRDMIKQNPQLLESASKVATPIFPEISEIGRSKLLSMALSCSVPKAQFLQHNVLAIFNEETEQPQEGPIEFDSRLHTLEDNVYMMSLRLPTSRLFSQLTLLGNNLQQSIIALLKFDQSL